MKIFNHCVLSYVGCLISCNFKEVTEISQDSLTPNQQNGQSDRECNRNSSALATVMCSTRYKVTLPGLAEHVNFNVRLCWLLDSTPASIIFVKRKQ